MTKAFGVNSQSDKTDVAKLVNIEATFEVPSNNFTP